MVVWEYIVAILLFCAIILFHELGHLLVAKRNDIKVNEFCLGFGPKLAGFTRGETEYTIRLIPFGGACIMEGEDGESTDSRAFPNKSVRARIAVVASGPIFNFIMALAFSVIIIASLGIERPVVGGVVEGYPAEEAGLQPGDEIIRMNNKHIHFYKEISTYTLFHSGETTEITFLRDGERMSVVLDPRYNEADGRYQYGIYDIVDYTRYGPARTLLYGIYDVKYWIQYTMRSLEMLVTNQLSLNDLSGPVGIVRTISDTYEESREDGPFYVFVNMLNIGILLSANLGVLNLLPIPALDGGRIVFLVVEGVRGKKIKPSREAMVNFIGMACLFALMFFVLFNDIRKIFI